MPNFVLVIDGKVVGNFMLPNRSDAPEDIANSFEKMVAIMSSNPTIVAHEERIAEDSTWDGTTFTPPA